MSGICFVLLAALALGSAQKEALPGCPAVGVSDTATHLAHPKDCNAFYSFVPVLEHCPSGLHFNPDKQLCDLPANAGCKCEGGSGGGDGGGNGGGDGSGNGGGDGGGNGGGNGGGDGSGNGGGNGGGNEGGNGGGSGNCPTRGKCPAVDPLDHTVHLPHLKDCNLFCRCDHGIPKLDQCPAGLHFNPVLQVCDWPQNAGCVISACEPLVNNNRSHWEPVSCSNDPSDVGDKCKLVCDQGFELSGSDSITCQDAGWNGTGGLNILPGCKTEEELGEGLVDNINKTLGKVANMLFLLDESGSVNPKDFDMEVKFAKALIGAFPLSVNRSAGIITFSSGAAVDISVKESDTCTFLKKADAIKYSGGGTDILRALTLAVDENTKNAVHNLTLFFLITDGESTTNPTAPANIIKSNGDILFTIGVGNYNRQQLEPLSSVESGAPLFYGIRNFAVFNAVANYLSTAYNNGTAVNCP